MELKLSILKINGLLKEFTTKILIILKLDCILSNKLF